MTTHTIHPDFPLEKEHLAQTVPVVAAYKCCLQTSAATATGAQQYAARASRDFYQEQAAEMEIAQSEPYFARIDFVEEHAHAVETLYIGPYHSDGTIT